MPHTIHHRKMIELDLTLDLFGHLLLEEEAVEELRTLFCKYMPIQSAEALILFLQSNIKEQSLKTKENIYNHN